MGAACSNNNKVVQDTTVKNKKNLKIKTDLGAKKGRRDEDVRDKDGAYFCNQERMHDALWQAIENNDQTAADKFLELNDVEAQNMYDPQGQTMLHMAALLGYHEMLMILIERTGAKPDMVNAQLATPLHLACKNNKEHVVKFLIGCGVDVNIQDEHGQTPLLICCIHGHKEIVSMLIEASISGQLTEPLEMNLANHQGLTPLNCASIKGDIETVKFLVQRGGAKVDQSSPKGCTPLIYAGRGGYSKIVEFLIEKKASTLKQDNAGGTVLHHAIEKGHIQVLETMLGQGVDVYSAIEIADNAGRTPIFEAVENLDEVPEPDLSLLNILTKEKEENGFGANPNVCNYSGQTPLFSAVRNGCLPAVQLLMQAGANPDLNNGELVKPDEDQEEDYDSVEEQYFLEAFKNCMTPLHLACTLGHDEIAVYLAEECGADPNLQSNHKGYSALHLSVLSNKPEMIIEMLSKTMADPYQADNNGQMMMDMVQQFIPSYFDTFEQILETLKVKRLKQQKREEAAQVVARHYVNKDDERQIAAPKTQEEIAEMYAKEMEAKPEEPDEGQAINLNSLDENDIAPGDSQMDSRIENVYGRKVALCFCSSNWQYKEMALKFVMRSTEKYLTRAEVNQQSFTLNEIVDGAMATVATTCRDKVIKVFNLSLQLFNMVIQSPRIERDIVGTKRVIQMLKQEQLISKFLQHSETSNTRVTNKIHESMLDLSYQAQLGENFVTVAVYELIRRHYADKQNHKGLMAQLALLYKLINSFKVFPEDPADGDDSDDLKALTKEQIIEVVLPSVCHTKDNIREAATKILVDVQKQTKNITLEDLEVLPEKIKEAVWEKVSDALADVLAQEPSQEPQVKERQKKVNVVNLEIGNNQGEDASKAQNQAKKLKAEQLEQYKQIVKEKGSHKDWTQREIALNSMQELFNMDIQDLLEYEEDFLSQCSILLQTSLNENNIQIYLIAVEVVLSFIMKVPLSEAVLDALPSFLQTVVNKTTDTNTRVRKRSVEVVNQIWDIPVNKKSNISSSQMVANVLMDPTHGEKAIIGRLGLFIKKALLIESSQDLSKKPLQLILGKDYEQLAQFACQWCLHKNTKVRQCALKLAVEICRLNSIDPRGVPFKKRITNMILGLRSSIRDPLVKKINEVCREANPKSKPEDQFIDESELEMIQSSKARAASYDVRGRATKQNPGKQARPGSAVRGGNALPQIGGSILPQVSQQDNANRPTIVLPHSESLNQVQLEAAANLIELFGKDIITCFFSQTWSTRLAAIEKVEEQLHNLDPQRRDAMSGEINRNNLPPEISFKGLLEFFKKGLEDPVLKNYITILDLIQTVLPFYFRYLRGEQLKRELSPIIQVIIQKTSDLKQKIREASINICLYMSHQSPIGPEQMISLVLGELEGCQWEKQDVNKKSDVTNTFGNSSMIVSCLSLLSQFQLQTSLVTEKSKFYEPYAANINKALKHSNPQVRKEGEALFRTMYMTYQEAYVAILQDQKPALVSKLVQDAKTNFAEKQAANVDQNQPAQSSAQIATKAPQQEDQPKEISIDYLNQPSIQALLKGNEDKIQQLKLPNPKKRLIAIVEIKKAIQQKLTQINPKSAHELVEPLSQLLRHLLRDENVDVFVESLNLLKFIVGNLAPHLSQLELHLMMGQFLTVIISSQNQNMRARVASDKVIVYFAKHTNVGSLVVAKEVLKNIERLNKSALLMIKAQQPLDEKAEEMKNTLSRTYGILQMLLQQFSIVLCYQPDFYQKCLDLLADTMSKSQEEPTLKSTCQALVVSLHQIDSKLLDQGVSNLDFTKKTHIKKMLIELENSNQKGLVTQNQNLVSGVGSGSRAGSPDASFRDTQQSFTSLNSRTSAMSPGLSMNRRLQRDRNSEIRQSKDSFMNNTNQSETKWRNQIDANPNQTDNTVGSASWIERRQNEKFGGMNQGTLPSITNQINNDGSGTARRRQVGQGFVGGSSKAAGFNRNEFNMTGEINQNPSRQQALSKQQDFVMGGGIGSNLLSANKKEDTITPRNMGGMPPMMPKRSSDMPTEESAGGRPPMYVPTQRTAQLKRDVGGYQPTIIGRMNSQNGDKSSMMGSTNSSLTQQNQPVIVKQNTGQLPPAAASFFVKNADKPEQSAQSFPMRKNSFY